jgi:hypothetical protein
MLAKEIGNLFFAACGFKKTDIPDSELRKWTAWSI